MGKIEVQARALRQRGRIQKAVLGVLAVSGLVALTALAPALVVGAGLVSRQMGYKLGSRARTAAGKLAEQGLLRFVTKQGRTYIEITEKGRHVMAFEAQRTAERLKKKRWDGRYRLVIFDIPERRKAVRRQLRYLMHTYGFLRIQDSVWLYPHDCEELVVLIKAELRVGKDILYGVLESIEHDDWIRKHFNLAA